MAICYQEELQLPTKASELAMSAKPAYRCRASFEILPTAVQITQCVRDTGARLNLIKNTLFLQSWVLRIQRGSLLKLRTAAK